MSDTTATRSMVVEHGVAVPMRDGTTLRADVWRPAEGGPHPAVLIRTPYGRALFNADALRPEHCVRAGYACVVQDVRGRGESEGDWVLFQWEQEGPDTYDSVEWVADQWWCDGAVGMCGASYLGIVQWVGATTRPPHLRAIAPGMATTAELEAVESGGALRLNQFVYQLALAALGWSADPAIQRRMLDLLRDAGPAVRHLPLESMPQFDIPDFPVRFGDLLNDAITKVPEVDFARVEVPTLSVAGWFDIYCSATVRSFLRMRDRPGQDEATRASHRLIIGPWTHDGQLPAVQGQCNFGPYGYASVADVPGRHLAFFDAHLRGTGAETSPPVRYFLMGANEWRAAESWPPPGTGTETWYLASDGDANTAAGSGRLDPEPPMGGAPEDTYRHDPDDPVPTRGGNVASMGTVVAGPLDQVHNEARADVVCYTSLPFEAAIDVVGDVTVRLFAATSARDADFVVKLVDVSPEGPALLVTGGILRARHRDGFTGRAPVEPETVYEFEVTMRPTAWRFFPGHQLRLDIASSDFPQYDRNTGTGNPLGVDREAVPSVQRIRHTTAQPSALRLSTMRPDDGE